MMGFSLFAAVIGFFGLLACLLSTEFGLYLTLFYCYFAFFLSRYLFNDTFPVGVVSDVLIYATFLSLLFRPTSLRKTFGSFTQYPLVILILFLTVYMMLELFNPYGHSFDGWFQTFRRFLASVTLLFICYNIFTSYEKVIRFANALFAAALITAVYGCIQQWHGLFDFELAWVTSSPNRFGLYFIMGNFRKFSTMSDPTAFGVAMAGASIFFIILGWFEKRRWLQVLYFAGVLLMILAMGYSGTRTANLMMVAGLGMFVLLSMNRKQTRIFAVLAGMVFLVLLYGPYSNPTIQRFRTSFLGKKDDSYNVRERNRHFIQPYIHSHPIGGGIATVGGAGLQFNPGHQNAGFPPDSGYLRKALETGWIGLGLTMLLYFMIMRFGIRQYFRVQNEKLKIIAAAALSSIFAFYIAEFAQEAIGQITDIVIYYPLVAMLLRMEDLDPSSRRRKLAEEQSLAMKG